MNEIEIRVARLPHGADLPLPAYQSKLASDAIFSPRSRMRRPS